MSDKSLLQRNTGEFVSPNYGSANVITGPESAVDTKPKNQNSTDRRNKNLENEKNQNDLRDISRRIDDKLGVSSDINRLCGELDRADDARAGGSDVVSDSDLELESDAVDRRVTSSGNNPSDPSSRSLMHRVAGIFGDRDSSTRQFLGNAANKAMIAGGLVGSVSPNFLGIPIARFSKGAFLGVNGLLGLGANLIRNDLVGAAGQFSDAFTGLKLILGLPVASKARTADGKIEFNVNDGRVGPTLYNPSASTRNNHAAKGGKEYKSLGESVRVFMAEVSSVFKGFGKALLKGDMAEMKKYILESKDGFMSIVPGLFGAVFAVFNKYLPFGTFLQKLGAIGKPLMSLLLNFDGIWGGNTLSRGQRNRAATSKMYFNSDVVNILGDVACEAAGDGRDGQRTAGQEVLNKVGRALQLSAFTLNGLAKVQDARAWDREYDADFQGKEIPHPLKDMKGYLKAVYTPMIEVNPILRPIASLFGLKLEEESSSARTSRELNAETSAADNSAYAGTVSTNANPRMVDARLANAISSKRRSSSSSRTYSYGSSASSGSRTYGYQSSASSSSSSRTKASSSSGTARTASSAAGTTKAASSSTIKAGSASDKSINSSEQSSITNIGYTLPKQIDSKHLQSKQNVIPKPNKVKPSTKSIDLPKPTQNKPVISSTVPKQTSVPTQKQSLPKSTVKLPKANSKPLPKVKGA